MKRAYRQSIAALVAALSIAPAFACAPAIAQRANPWTLGIVDASFVWSPQAGVAASIPKCAYDLAKQNGYVAAKASPNQESPLQVCLLKIMHEDGAPKNAIAFTQWFYWTPYGDSAYITALAKPQYGPVQLASIFYPGNANNNDAYLFVNGTNPRVTDPKVIFAPAAQPWKHDAGYRAILSAHPNAFVYATLSFVKLERREGGGQRFTLAAPIVDGCHACARLGTVDIAYDFGSLGAPKGATLVAVHPSATTSAPASHPTSKARE
ncbi:MAG: hypothetical protein JO175_08440 [Candidatus Eremiobacteraeota bacterium]|nr:hypothetical protein [Candidatus Eremiobacteraeota bacterium]